MKSLELLPSSAQAQAQAQLGAEIALFSQLWGTYTLHPTPYTLPARNSSFCLSRALLSQLLGLLHDLFSHLVHTLFMPCS